MESMMHESATVAQRAKQLITHIGERLLLVPEAVFMIALLIAALWFDSTPLIGMLIAALTVILTLRVGALYLAQNALQAGRYQEAASLAWLAYLLYPWSADTLALRGALALADGSLVQAAWLLRRSIKLFPHAASTHTTLAGVQLALGRVSAAQIEAQYALTLAPDTAIAYLYLAEAALAEGADRRDIEDLLRQGLHIASRPDDIAALSCALAAILIEQGRAAESAFALNGIEPTLKQCSAASQTRLCLRYGELLLAQGQVERAREYLQGAVVLERIHEQLSVQGR